MLWLVRKKVRRQQNRRKLNQEREDTKMSVMLYKCPGKELLHGIECDYIVVEEADVEKNIKKGWFLSTTEAKEAFDNKKPKKAEAKKETKKEADTLDILDEEAEDVLD
jgi:hypothetical protein